MKKFLLATVGLIALGMAAPASAADMAVKAAPAPYVAPIYNWTGFYIGGNGGWGSSHQCLDFVGLAGTVFGEGCNSRSGGIVGGQVGYRWQSSQWVFGVEAQGDWADLSNTRISLFDPRFSLRTKTDSLGLFTGQIGYAWNTALLYFKGGAAVIADRNDLVTGGNAFATASGDNRWGGAVGAGVEFSFAPNWSAAFEYDHLFIANANTTFTSLASGAVVSSDRLRGDTDLVSVRVNYRWGGPVVAKY